MKVTIVTDVESEYMNDDELKDNIYGIVTDFLAQAGDIGMNIRVQEVSYPAN